MKITVHNDNKLSAVLSIELPWLGNGGISRIIRDGVTINGKRVTSNVNVVCGDVIVLVLPNTLCAPNIDVVYSDENVLIVDKPTHVDSVDLLPKLLVDKFGTLYPVHRLDVNTTGLIVLARGTKTKAELEKAFRERTIIKKYMATVVGVPKQKTGVLHNWLMKDDKKGLVTVFKEKTSGALEAITEYEVVSSADGLSVLALYPKTGRTHQLRAQLSFAGMPILGDGKYGNFAENKRRGLNVQMLRAVSIEFVKIGGIINYLLGKKFEVAYEQKI